MAVSSIKYALGVATLSFIAATGVPAYAQMGGDHPEPDATPEQIKHACKNLSAELSKPGMSALMQGAPQIDPGYDPQHLRRVLQDACGITLQQWTKMPDISRMKKETVANDATRVCGKIHDAIHGDGKDADFSAGVNAIIHGSEYADQSFHHACMGAQAPSAQASMNYKNPAAKLPEPTKEEIENACARFVKAMDGHVGITIILKGHAAFPDYDPKPVAAAIRSHCAIDDATWNKAPSHGWKGEKGQPMTTRAQLVQYLADGVKQMRTLIRSHPGFNKLIEGDAAARASFEKITQTAYTEAKPIDIVGGAPGAVTPPSVAPKPR